jgi:hypothetical protein
MEAGAVKEKVMRRGVILVTGLGIVLGLVTGAAGADPVNLTDNAAVDTDPAWRPAP